MREGWLIDADDHWIWRDESAWVRDPKMFLDRGRLLHGEEPLLRDDNRHPFFVPHRSRMDLSSMRSSLRL